MSGSTKVMLEHLVVVPKYGLGNRMRVIASAKRLCQITQAQCTLVWNWPGYDTLFQKDPLLEVISEIPRDIAAKYQVMCMKSEKEGGSPETRRIPLDQYRCLIVHSCFAFCSINDEKPLTEVDLRNWFPQPSDGLRKRAAEFRDAKLSNLNIVGLHMRRTDNKESLRDSPDDLFVKEINSLIQNGLMAFLATDNRETEEPMRARFGESVIFYPKNPCLTFRWPRRAFDLAETIDDYMDLLLLASCDYVLGSSGSSFSMVAMALNGSPECRSLRRLL